MSIIQRTIKTFFSLCTCIVIAIFMACVVINIIMFVSVRNSIHNPSNNNVDDIWNSKSLANFAKNPKDYILVLGASVHGKKLSNALRARMLVAIHLYQSGAAHNILLSGDGSNSYYDETAAMKRFAIDYKIPEKVIITDEKGYTTYSTILRAKEVFNMQSAYIVSQNFHLMRAVWIAQKIGIQAEGIGAGNLKEVNYYMTRDFFARVKDFIQISLKIPPDVTLMEREEDN